MIERFVNLSNFNTNAGTGFDQYNQMNYITFVTDLQNGEILTDDITYYLSGARASWDFCGETDITLNVYKLNFSNIARIIYFKSYSGEPWKFLNYGNDGSIQFNVLNNSNANDVGHKLYFQNGMMIAPNGGIYVYHQQSNSYNVVDSNHFQSKNSVLFPNSNNIDVRGSTIIAQYVGGDQYQNISIVNTIMGVDNLQTRSGVKNIKLDNVVFTNVLENFPGYENCLINGSIQNNFSKPDLWDDLIVGYDGGNIYSEHDRQHATSAFPNKREFSYLLPEFKTITISGNKNSNVSSSLPWEVRRRDGVGFLYFDSLGYNVVKPLETSGYTPWECVLNFNGQLTSASKLEIDWRDGSSIETFTTGISASHVYSNTAEYIIRVRNYSYNQWYNQYDFCAQDLTVNSYDDTAVSADLVFVSPYNGNVITQIYENTSVWLSATGIFGRVVKWEFETTNGVFIDPFSAYNIDGYTNISTSLFYDLNSNGTETSTLHLNRGYPNHYTVQLNLSILDITTPPAGQAPYVPSTYWVNLNQSTSGVGTSGNPYNYSQLYERIKYQGSANIGETYYLKGYTNLSRPLSASRPYTVFDIDYRKNFTLDVWDALTYGPWMISIDDDYFKSNHILDFRGCTLKNGIIYNKPEQYGSSYYGGTFKCSSMYNMWIVNQGKNSEFYLNPLSATTNIRGCTIFVDNKININTSLGTGNINVIDNVINKVDLNNSFGQFNSTNLYFYNNCFGSTSGTFTGLSNIYLSANQFNWNYDQDWPLTVNDRNYDKNLEWILANKNDFIPFENIEEYSNPGYGYSTYNLYEKGLFGFLRNLYYRN